MNSSGEAILPRRNEPGPRALIYRRIIEEICAMVGSDVAARLMDGERLRVGEQICSFIHDEHYQPGMMFIYADLGQPPAGEQVARLLLQLNFDFMAGARGVISLHPENGNLFFSMRYKLTMASRASELLEELDQSAMEIRSALRQAGHAGPPGRQENSAPAAWSLPAARQ